MNVNPFSAPLEDSGLPQNGPNYIRHRAFRSAPLTIFVTAKKRMDELRQQAEVFINAEVGADNVVTINENVGFEYSVVVWFRARAS